MRQAKQSLNTDVPELEQTELTEHEEQVFLNMIENMLPNSAEETQQFLESHRQEAQGE